MKYKFCKINLFGKISGWTLEINNYDLYKEWSDKYHTKIFQDGVDNIIYRSNTWKKDGKYKTQGHWTSEIASLSEKVGGDEHEIDLIDGFEKVTNDYINSKFKAIQDGNTIYVYEGCQWFILPDNCEIVETIESDILEYPNQYTEKDIRIIKYENGKHYYAKIGMIEVVDDDGSRKWNTYKYAYDIAIDYLKKL